MRSLADVGQMFSDRQTDTHKYGEAYLTLARCFLFSAAFCLRCKSFCLRSFLILCNLQDKTLVIKFKSLWSSEGLVHTDRNRKQIGIVNIKTDGSFTLTKTDTDGLFTLAVSGTGTRTETRTWMNGLYGFVQSLSHCTWTGTGTWTSTGKNGLYPFFRS